MEISEIKDLIVWAKKQNIHSFEVNGVKVVFNVELPPNTGELDLEGLNKSFDDQDLTDDEVLHWSG